MTPVPGTGVPAGCHSSPAWVLLLPPPLTAQPSPVLRAGGGRALPVAGTCHRLHVLHRHLLPLFLIFSQSSGVAKSPLSVHPEEVLTSRVGVREDGVVGGAMLWYSGPACVTHDSEAVEQV